VGEASTVVWREFRLGEWRVRPQLNTLELGEEVVHLEAKPMAVLVDLAEHAGRVRSKRQLLRSVWGGAFVSDEVLTRAIWLLRKALGDDPKDPRYIQTIPRKGYRVVAEVTWEPPTEVSDERFPYRLGEQLGAGAMGAVYRAEDTRLRRTVALKFLPRELSSDQAAKDRFLREARAAAKLDHPHIAVVHDIGEGPDGRMYLAMAHYRGGSLKQKLEGGPLPVEEAVELARQIAEGLAAAHGQGIVHRDIKPANVMLTDEGQAKIVDFGLARGVGDTTLTRFGSTVGTVLYMSPEQARGEGVDPRSDLWSLGVALYEVISGERPFKGANDQAVLYSILHEEPVKLSVVRPEVPPGLEAIVHRCLEKEADSRYQEASVLLQDLVAVLEHRRPVPRPGEEVSPYPGLDPFTEEKAPFFFGREPEVAAMWEKLRGRKLLALIGPSGAGKTSFVRAGLIPGRPDGWRCLVCTPGSAPFVSLGQVLAPELAGDPEALRELPRVDKPEAAFAMLSRWRRRFEQALLVVDQFEELFTLNPAGVQASFAKLLGRLATDGDLHVLVSLRDDFLIHCHAHPTLSPVFEELTPLTAPRGPALQQALVEPAAALGYAFDGESLVEEMMAEVEEERGALPLAAFAAARLWERRDRKAGLLTREAYEAIGGVGGALAQHAEATLERIGSEKIPIVRETFRNLVTAQGTRAARDREELLSVFGDAEAQHPPATARLPTGSQETRARSPSALAGDIPDQTQPSTELRQGRRPATVGDRASAAEVLDTLIGARLLTSFEVPAAEDETDGHHRIEIIHESLLTSWPRLVRWQTQDTEGAQLRDELRQAAQMWDQHDRSEDLLWTGTAFQEFQLWRERYPGGLSETEEAYARAMADHAERSRRRRRAVVASTFVVLLAVLTVIGGFWRRSVKEARRAEAANLSSLAQLQLEKHPTATIAYAIASLELADSLEVRRLVVKALWVGPTEFRIPTSGWFTLSLDFSPDGRWLAVADPGGLARLWPSDGGPPTVLEGGNLYGNIRTSPRGDVVAATMLGRQKLGLWSFPEGRFLRSFAVGSKGTTYIFQFSRDGEHLLTNTELQTEGGYEFLIRSWPVAGGEPDVLARLEVPEESVGAICLMDPTLSRIAWVDGRRVRVARLEGTTVDLASATSVEHDSTVVFSGFDRQGRQLVTADKAGTIRIWSLESDPPELTHTPSGGWGGEALFFFDDTGSMLAGLGGFLWDLSGPPEAERLLVRHPDWTIYGLAIDPGGNWLATSAGEEHPLVLLWPVGRSSARILRVQEGPVLNLAFTPDGERLVSVSVDGSVRVWPLVGGSGERSRELHKTEAVLRGPGKIAMAPDGSFVAAGTRIGLVLVVPLDGEPVRVLGESGEFPADRITALAVGPSARLVAGGSRDGIVRIWDLASGDARIPEAGDGGRIHYLKFTEDRDLWAASRSKLRRWSLDGGQPRLLEEIDLESPEFVPDELCDVDPDGQRALFREGDRLWIMDSDTGEVRQLSSHGSVGRAQLYANGELVASTNRVGGLRIGPATGEEPHLLLGHEDEVNAIAVSPDGRWIASGGDDSTIRLWPMPDFSKPPLHALPREELIAKLKGLTNLRAVSDEESPSGWKIEADPFPGWTEVPEW
jgi:WD40 repeat protein/DNA-binding winged helix-turn-helix (wHTH) protein